MRLGKAKSMASLTFSTNSGSFAIASGTMKYGTCPHVPALGLLGAGQPGAL
jgi:hypothetical protein